jgi:hypothetical protein
MSEFNSNINIEAITESDIDTGLLKQSNIDIEANSDTDIITEIICYSNINIESILESNLSEIGGE